MIYGISGAHRSGKTTLARKIAEDMDLHFLKIDTTGVAKANGFDPVAPMDYLTRCALQDLLFTDFCEQLERAPRPVITDRTPLDHVTYLISETTMLSGGELNPRQMQCAEELITKAIDYAAVNFDTIFYLAPLPTYEVDPTKPPPNPVYQFGYAATMMGILQMNRERMNYVTIENSSMEVRVETLRSIIANRMNWIQKERAQAAWIH